MQQQIVLKTENLIKRYGSLVAVQDLNLEIFQGEIFGILGPNGAGKTTSIQMMCGLLKPDSGQVWLHDQPLTSHQARRMVGICPQQIVVWEKLTCIEQLQFIGQMYGLSTSQSRERAERLLKTLDLGEKRDCLGQTLSGGLQRRLNLALALVHDPQIVILDEPEAGLDPQSRLLVRELIRGLSRQRTVILTTHNMDEAERLVDRVAIIDHGHLLVLDSPQSLKRHLGEGDVLEVGMSDPSPDLAEIEQSLSGLPERVEVRLTSDSLTLRSLNLIQLLPRLLEALSKCGIRLTDIRLRTNTLEDVFIQLTGRRLRD